MAIPAGTALTTATYSTGTSAAFPMFALNSSAVSTTATASASTISISTGTGFGTSTNISMDGTTGGNIVFTSTNSIEFEDGGKGIYREEEDVDRSLMSLADAHEKLVNEHDELLWMMERLLENFDGPERMHEKYMRRLRKMKNSFSGLRDAAKKALSLW
jgi:hypothetical protein